MGRKLITVNGTESRGSEPGIFESARSGSKSTKVAGLESGLSLGRRRVAVWSSDSGRLLGDSWAAMTSAPGRSAGVRA